MEQAIRCTIRTGNRIYSGFLFQVCGRSSVVEQLPFKQLVGGSAPLTPAKQKRSKSMHPLEIARDALAQKSRRRFDEKMDQFVIALNHTKEGRELRKRMRHIIAKTLKY